MRRLSSARSLAREKVAELLLDHAQVAGFCRHRAKIAHLPGQLQPLRHPAAGLRDLTAHLGGDAEYMQSAGASALVHQVDGLRLVHENSQHLSPAV